MVSYKSFPSKVQGFIPEHTYNYQYDTRGGTITIESDRLVNITSGNFPDVIHSLNRIFSVFGDVCSPQRMYNPAAMNEVHGTYLVTKTSNNNKNVIFRAFIKDGKLTPNSDGVYAAHRKTNGELFSVWLDDPSTNTVKFINLRTSIQTHANHFDKHDFVTLKSKTSFNRLGPISYVTNSRNEISYRSYMNNVSDFDVINWSNKNLGHTRPENDVEWQLFWLSRESM